MEGAFWSMILAFAPLWAWAPCLVLAEVIILVDPAWPWWLRWFPAWLYLASFGPMVYGMLWSAGLFRRT